MNGRADALDRPLAVGFVLLAASLLLPACEGSSSTSSERQLRKKLERRAALRPKRATVTLGAIHHFVGPDTKPPFRAPLGADGSIEIEEAYAVVSAIELHACVPNVDDYTSPDGPVLNWFLERFVSTAHAHVANSTVRLGTPYVENLLGEADRARIIGEIGPPLAAYCRVAAVLAPADADVRNSTPLSTESIVGSSLLVRGRYRRAKGDDWQEFAVRTDAARVFEFEAVDPKTGTAPLVLESRRDEQMVLIDKRIGPETFAVDPTAKRAGLDILERLGASMRVYEF